jgi:hypothetical protein
MGPCILFPLDLLNRYMLIHPHMTPHLNTFIPS